jgi:hypothetical protein
VDLWSASSRLLFQLASSSPSLSIAGVGLEGGGVWFILLLLFVLRLTLVFVGYIVLPAKPDVFEWKKLHHYITISWHGCLLAIVLPATPDVFE